MDHFKVIFYRQEDGTEPVKDFILSLDKKMRAKVMKELKMLSRNGPELREPYSKPLEDGIFELRAQFGSDITRVLYFFFVGRRIILTNGFVKKTQKTPPEEIDRAKRCRSDYLKRKENSDD